MLVLDKALHLFPWESLPCLQGYPVCRVPSLQCLRERVLQFRESRSGALVDRGSGSFLLNPTGDLRTTQSTFEPNLSGLKSWTGVVNREPTEDEFRDCLESKDLFLYFGHGSGAQYIRGRTVKRLSKCGVAFLMGCSSGTLTEAGHAGFQELKEAPARKPVVVHANPAVPPRKPVPGRADARAGKRAAVDSVHGSQRAETADSPTHDSVSGVGIRRTGARAPLGAEHPYWQGVRTRVRRVRRR